ncbi:MAG TPA: AAA family ATPase, partial [Nitrospiria bacterium]|nr:AAA family ATPase [Nitrospiria bacterium]
MIALELVLYGVRHFLDMKKLTFGPGFNLVHGRNGAGKTTIADTFFEILSWEKDRPTLQSLAPLERKDLCQAALIFQSQDGGIYRLVRDFLKDIGSLSKLDQNNKFNLLSKDEDQITGFIHSEIQKLSPGQLRDELLLSRAGMPSSSHFTSHAAGPASQTGNQSKTSDLASSPLKAKRLEEIRASLVLADQIAKFEEQLDKVQNRLLELRRQHERYENDTQELKQLLQEQAAYEGFQDLPKNVSSLLDEYKITEKTHTQEVRELDEQRISIEDQLTVIPATPIFLSKLFLAGIGVMVLSLLLALFLQLGGVWQTLYFLGLLTGAVLVVVSVFLDVRRLTHRKSIEGKLGEISHAQEISESRFKKQNTAVFDLLKKASCQNVDQLKDKIRSYLELARSIQNLKEEQSRLLGNKSLPDLEREQQALTVSAKELESKIKGVQGTTPDIYSLQEEMRTIQREIQEQKTLKPKEAVKAEQVPDQTVTEERSSSVTSFRRPKQFETVPKKLFETHATEWLRRLTQGRYDRLEYDPQSNLTLIDRKGSPALFDQLSSGVQDQVYLSILWAGWQLTSSGAPALPLVLDDPLVGLDEASRQVAIETLKELGQHRQIILLTTASHPNKD